MYHAQFAKILCDCENPYQSKRYKQTLIDTIQELPPLHFYNHILMSIVEYCYCTQRNARSCMTFFVGF